MTDDEAGALLAGIDGPRPLPPALRRELLDVVVTDAPLRDSDAARPLPDDLRHRLEATLITATPMPVPRAVRRRIVRASRDRLQTMARAAAVLVVVLGAVVALGQRNDGGQTADQAEPERSPVPAAGSDAPAGQDSVANEAGRYQRATVADVGVLGDPASPAVVGFRAYAAPARAAALGAPREAADATAEFATTGVTVNLLSTPIAGGDGSVVFETAFVRAADLADGTISVGLPVEEQARLAVTKAYPEEGSGRAVVVVSAGEPWASAGRAFESALRSRGVEPRRVSYTSGAPRGAPAVFLALSPADVRAYLGAHPTAPSRGIHAIASAYDDDLAQAGLTVLSPFAPPGGAEEAQLRAALPDGRLTAEAVHGWVTAKVVEELLRRTGGAPPTAADVAALDGWSPGWGVVIGRPGAYVVRADGGRFGVVGRFLPASPDR
jgi:hypothetical protein